LIDRDLITLLVVDCDTGRYGYSSRQQAHTGYRDDFYNGDCRADDRMPFGRY